jgi:hypothetical protein
LTPITANPIAVMAKPATTTIRPENFAASSRMLTAEVLALTTRVEAGGRQDAPGACRLGGRHRPTASAVGSTDAISAPSMFQNTPPAEPVHVGSTATRAAMTTGVLTDHRDTGATDVDSPVRNETEPATLAALALARQDPPASLRVTADASKPVCKHYRLWYA